jgi:hypothetical protein
MYRYIHGYYVYELILVSVTRYVYSVYIRGRCICKALQNQVVRFSKHKLICGKPPPSNIRTPYVTDGT